VKRRGSTELAFSILLAVAFVVPTNLYLAKEVEKRRISTSLEEELAFYPSGRYLRPVAGGFRHLLADMLWLRAIQYYGEHRKTDLVFDKAGHVFEVLTDLDPHFVEAFRFGALVLVEDADEPEWGIELLRKGIRENPDRWELYFDLGFHYFRLRQYEYAASYFHRAARFPEVDSRVARFAAAAEERRGDLETARALWEEVLQTTNNSNFQEAARFALKTIDAAEDTARIGAVAREFRKRHGRYPIDPSELAARGYIAGVPTDPFGWEYLIHPKSGEVQSSYLLSRQVNREMRVLQKVVDNFRRLAGRLPMTLEETVREGLLESVPSSFGARYEIERGSGRVVVRFDHPRLAGKAIFSDRRGGEDL